MGKSGILDLFDLSTIMAAMTTGMGGPTSELDFTYSKTDVGFDSFGKRIGGYMNTEAPRLGIDTEAVDVMTGSTGNFSK